VIRHSFLGINEEGGNKRKGGRLKERLNNNTKKCYLEKLLDINNIWTRKTCYRMDERPKALPPFTYPDIVNHLVYDISA